MASKVQVRVLIGKPGLDGHDVGAKLVCRSLMEAGMEVIYTGLRQTPAAIANTAQQEAVDVVGLSILSGAHVPLCRKFAQERTNRGLDKLLWVVGGNIPQADHAELHKIGVDGIFPTGSTFSDLVEFIHKRVTS